MRGTVLPRKKTRSEGIRQFSHFWTSTSRELAGRRRGALSKATESVCRTVGQPRPLDIPGRVRHVCLTMKTATVRDLRKRFPRIAAWIEQGQPVEITRGGKVFAAYSQLHRESPTASRCRTS